MKQFTAVLIGSTGLVGSELLRQLMNDEDVTKVRILVRRPVADTHPKLEIELIDFEDVLQFKNAIGSGDVIFSCVGTTNKKVQGDEAAYRKVDFDIPVNAAKFGKEAGFEKFLMISSVGANAKSNNFYLRLKGEVEEAVEQTAMSAIAIFRPGFLMGNRREKRTGESVMKFLSKIFSFVFIGPLKKYRSVSAHDLAAAMINVSKKDWKEVRIIEGGEMW